ncbi:hypothetical protein R3I93_015101 [Phoxinus phoxinus]|uniref:USP domain-containing protein n=1 Tax=Phoxinus phoxinus TaxID=58324 RepID=A0AAN9CMQ9_9TELE
MTEDFRNTEKRDKPIDLHIAQLFTDLKSKKKSVATTERITDVLNVNVYEQQDAAEFFQKIMNMVNPEMSKVFKGELEHNTMCKNPGKEHPLVTRHESFYIIPICMETYGMDSTMNMQSCFDSYFEPIKISEDDQVKCPTCKELVDTEIKCGIHKLPPVLVVQLERFQLDYSTMNYKKNKSTVEIQFQLSVKDGSGAQHKYDLYAVVKHSGSFSGGHYYAVIKSFEDHQWYEFNDSSVHKIDDLKNPFHCNMAYFLLYKKSSNESENAPHDPGNRPEVENNESDATANTQQTPSDEPEPVTQPLSDQEIKRNSDTCAEQSSGERKEDASGSGPDPPDAPHDVEERLSRALPVHSSRRKHRKGHNKKFTA